MKKRISVFSALCFLLALAGYFAPWVAHRTAALSLNGWELTTWAKPLPDVRSGALLLRADWLYAPLAAAGLGTALVGALWRPRAARGWLLRLAGAGVCLLALPQYPQVLSAYKNDPEFGPPFYLAVAGAAACVLSFLAWWLPARWRPLLRVPVAAAGAYYAPAMFAALLPAIGAVYHETIGFGWGTWLTIGAFSLAGLAALAEAIGVGGEEART